MAEFTRSGLPMQLGPCL